METIATGFRVLAWLGGLTFIVIGAVLLMNSTDQLKTYAILGAAGCLIYAVGMWVTLMAMAEGITLFVDIAYDVRSIATRSSN